MKDSDSIDSGDINIPCHSCASIQSCLHSAKHVRYLKIIISALFNALISSVINKQSGSQFKARGHLDCFPWI